MKIWKITSITLILLLPYLGIAQVTYSPEHPRQGDEVELTFETPQEYLKVTYRPNSSIVETDSIPLENATSYTWTPKKAGVYNLETKDFSTNISIRYRGFSWPGLVVMILAALILFGGAGFAFRNLFKKSEEREEGIDLDIEHRPDT